MDMNIQHPHDAFCAHCDRGPIQVAEQGHAADCPLRGGEARTSWEKVDWVGFTDALDHLAEIRRNIGVREPKQALYYAHQLVGSLTK